MRTGRAHAGAVRTTPNHLEIVMYQGHLNDGSSVQKHSAGAIYPYVIQVRDRAPGAYWWELLGPGLRTAGRDVVLRFETYDEAFDAGKRLLAVRSIADAWAFELERVARSCGMRILGDDVMARIIGDRPEMGGGYFGRMSQAARVEVLLALGIERLKTKAPVSLAAASAFINMARRAQGV
jgi:hypothetical protein